MDKVEPKLALVPVHIPKPEGIIIKRTPVIRTEATKPKTLAEQLGVFVPAKNKKSKCFFPGCTDTIIPYDTYCPIHQAVMVIRRKHGYGK